MALTDITTYLPPYASNTRPAVQNAPILTNPAPVFAQKHTVGRVNGYEGVSNYPMAPDSSELILDESMPVIWLVITDQNGTKTTIKGFNIGGEYEPPKPVTMEDLMNEMRNMSDRLLKVEEGYANGQSGTRLPEQTRSAGTTGAVHSAGKGSGSGPANGQPAGAAQPSGQ